MAAADDILAALAANLAQPKRARTEAGEVEQHDLVQQVAAAKFAIQQAAVSRSPFLALRFAQTMSSNANGGADPATAAAIYPPPGVDGLPGYPYQ
jgi:hypothetical protein